MATDVAALCTSKSTGFYFNFFFQLNKKQRDMFSLTLWLCAVPMKCKRGIIITCQICTGVCRHYFHVRVDRNVICLLYPWLTTYRHI